MSEQAASPAPPVASDWDEVRAPAVAQPRPRRIVQLQAAVVVALAGLVLAGGTDLSWTGSIVALAVVQAALIAAWVPASRVPGWIGTSIVAAAAAGGADAVVSVWHDHGYQPVLGVLGVAVPVLFVHQITRGVVRSRVVESLSSSVLLIVAVTALAGLVVLRHQDDGVRWAVAAVLSAAAGVTAGLIVDTAFPLPRFDPALDRGLAGVLLGAVAGGGVGWALLHDRAGFDAARAAFAGGGTALVACLVSVGATFALSQLTVAPETISGRVRSLRPVAGALFTLALSTPVGYLLISAIGS